RSSFDSSCASGFGNSDGTSIYDTNLLNSASGRVDGYLALDQPGAGTGPIGAQTSDPIYIWGNTSGKICLGGTNQYASCTSNSDCPSSTCSTKVTTPNNVYLHNNINNQPYHIVSGRDYFENTARPGYTKYTCPHPLAGSGSCDSTVAGRAGYAITEPSVTVPAPNPVATYAVTVSKNGSGTVTSSPLGIDCESTCSYSFTSGTSVTLTAVADTGYSFGSWSGACTGTNATCTLTMDAAKSVTATFIQNTHPLTVTKAATNTGTGIVTSADSGITCGSDCSESYTYGTIVTLSAAADSGSAFYGWSGACTGTTSTCQVTMDAAKNVIASFLAQGSPALITSKKGTGNGKIKSISAVLASNIAASNSIDCGDVCVAQYDNATKVTLTAEPEAGSTFSGWEGACSGTGACVVTVNSLTSVVATFSLQASGGSPTTMLSVGGDGGGGGGGCFIATAAYGSYLDPHVMTLREFRDKVLLRNSFGRVFVKFYYAHSPAIAHAISQNDVLRVSTRLLLTPIILTVIYPYTAGMIFLT
ncbi:MAG TPA: InlB B-repeat-containing protein, partial [Bacteroidia bacterium]|nr:InlB B-repeat-containing protein [Bacteroidia bacterium]